MARCKSYALDCTSHRLLLTRISRLLCFTITPPHLRSVHRTIRVPRHSQKLLLRVLCCLISNSWCRLSIPGCWTFNAGADNHRHHCLDFPFIKQQQEDNLHEVLLLLQQQLLVLILSTCDALALLQLTRTERRPSPSCPMTTRLNGHCRLVGGWWFRGRKAALHVTFIRLAVGVLVYLDNDGDVLQIRVLTSATKQRRGNSTPTL